MIEIKKNKNEMGSFDFEIINNEFPEPDCPRNRIISGAPGTGKSYSLEEDRKEYFGRENLYTRVTFHPAYSYAQFFGCFKPISKLNKESGEKGAGHYRKHI